MSNESDIVKICKNHGELTLNEVYRASKGKYNCKKCAKISNDKWKKNNPGLVNLVSKKSWNKNKHKHKETRLKEYKRWRENNIDKARKDSREICRRTRKELRASYIKGLITKGSNLNASEISENLVEVKRASIILKRFIKKVKIGS